MEDYAIQCAKWLENRVCEAEANDLRLRPLKNQINDLTGQLKYAQQSEIPELLHQQNRAIQELINHVLQQAGRPNVL